MVYINDEYRFIFIENPKSGSTSILKVLEETLNIKIERHPRLSHLTTYEVKQMYPEQWDSYLKISTCRNQFERWCSCMIYDLHGKRNTTPNGKIVEVYDYDTLDKLKTHIQNPGNCVWCIPQDLFTENCDIILDININLQEQWNQLHNQLKLPGEPVTVQHKNINTDKKFSKDQLLPLYQMIYREN